MHIIALLIVLFSASVAHGVVAHDAASESHTGTTGSVSEATFSWTHTPVGTPRGVLVFVGENTNTDFVTSITYGGVAVPSLGPSCEAADTAGQPRFVATHFLGSSIPTGAQTVEVTRTNNATTLYAIAITVTAATNTEIKGSCVLLQEDGTLSEQNVDAGAGIHAVRYGFASTGLDAVAAAGASSTDLHTIDLGTSAMQAVRETTAGTGSRAVGFTSISDSRAAVHIAVGEVVVPRRPQRAIIFP